MHVYPKEKNEEIEKKCPLMPYAVISPAEVVLREQLAGRAETTDLLHRRGGGRTACTEEFPRLVFFQGMTLVVLAIRTVLPADLPVLFGILYNGFARVYHRREGVRVKDNRSFYSVFPAFIGRVYVREKMRNVRRQED